MVEEVKIKLFYDHILTTLEYEDATEGGILLNNYPKEIQTVVACGPNSGVKVGDKVAIAYNRFPVHREAPKNGIGRDKETVILPGEKIDGKEYMLLSTRELKWVVDA